MKLYTAPESIPADAAKPDLFLAGGITNVHDWQAKAVEALSNLPITLYNPRRVNYNHSDSTTATEQIKWEFDALEQADAILFWFAEGDSVQPITLYELGSWARTDKPLIIGVHPDYVRSLDVHFQIGLLRPELEISTDFDELLERARASVNSP